jgi:hypothetical protein
MSVARRLALGSLFAAGCSLMLAHRTPDGRKCVDSRAMPIADVVLAAATAAAEVSVAESVHQSIGTQNYAFFAYLLLVPLIPVAAALPVSFSVSAGYGFTRYHCVDVPDEAACAAAKLSCSVAAGRVVCQAPAEVAKARMLVRREHGPNEYVVLTREGCTFTAPAPETAVEVEIGAYDAAGALVGTTNPNPATP